MNEKEIREKIAVADKNDLNYFEIYGTDSVDNTEKHFPKQYFEYRRKWMERSLLNDPEDFPLHLDVEATNRCNLRCSMCQIDFNSMKQGNMDMELYARIMKECKENKLPSIKLNYRGESTTNKDLPLMIKLAKDAGIIEVQLNTNGVVLAQKLAIDLIDSGLDRIKFSIDGATPEVYKKIRGADYYKVISNVEQFINIRKAKKKIFPIIQVQMVSMQDNKDDVVKYVQFWENKVNRIGFSRYRSAKKKLYDDRRVELLPLVTVPCAQLWQRLLVTFDGIVIMCCGDQKMELPVGNINQSTLKQIWLSPQLQKYRQLQIENRSNEIKICPSCEINKTDAKKAKEIWQQTLGTK